MLYTVKNIIPEHFYSTMKNKIEKNVIQQKVQILNSGIFLVEFRKNKIKIKKKNKNKNISRRKNPTLSRGLTESIPYDNTSEKNSFQAINDFEFSIHFFKSLHLEIKP